MAYSNDYFALRDQFNLRCERVEIANRNIVIENRWFESKAFELLPGMSRHCCQVHNFCFDGTHKTFGDQTANGWLNINDAEVDENRRFRYATFFDKRQTQARGVILLLHGLNEREWTKYLPWAVRLVESTGKAVVLFPIAFHMNRAPLEWSRPRAMRPLSLERQATSSKIANSSFANAAISIRLASQPERFCWSGLQTLNDLVQLAGAIRCGELERIAPDASIDIFAYSIGAFLAEILVMGDRAGTFADSKLFMFCGGATFDRMYPNSRFILDSDATIAIYAYFLARFENELRENARLRHYLDGAHPEVRYFRAMLNYQDGKAQRETRLREIAPRIAAFALRQDRVVPGDEVVNTLQGEAHDIPVSVEIADFPFEYSHVKPFPVNGHCAEVEHNFAQLISAAASHFQ